MIKKILFFSFCLCFLVSVSANAAEKIRLGVMPFLIRTSTLTGDYSMTVSDMVVKMLQVSPSISVIERERLRVIAMEQGLKVNADNNDSIIKLGQVAGCQYMLLGSIVEVAHKHSSTKFFSNTYYDYPTNNAEDDNHEYRATLEARVVEVLTGRIVLSFSKSGSAIKLAKQNNYGEPTYLRALETASSRLVDDVRKVLANEYAMIISVNKNNIRINRGRASGVNVGSLYKVYQEGEEIFDLNGKYLGKREINLALLRVVSVQNEFAVTEIVNNDVDKQQNIKKTDKKSAKTKRKSKKRDTEEKELQTEKPILIREGDKIEAISFAEAEKLKLSDKRIGEEK